MRPAAGVCKHRPDDHGWGRAERPVINVSWEDAKAYLAWLSQKTGQKLPAAQRGGMGICGARGHRDAPYWWGRDVGTGFANCATARRRRHRQTMPVGSFRPNRFGLYDTAGNAAEWVEDCWNDNYRNAPKDGSAWIAGDCRLRVLRGGVLPTAGDRRPLGAAVPLRPRRALLRERIPRDAGSAVTVLSRGEAMRAIVTVMLICASEAALAQSYPASGQIGYLQEWEIKGSLAKTSTRSGAEYAGPVTLRHVGLCSVNGVEEKAGVVQLKVSAARLEGTLTMADDNCRIVASASSSYQGLLSCRNGQGVPIHFSIDGAVAAAVKSLR